MCPIFENQNFHLNVSAFDTCNGVQLQFEQQLSFCFNFFIETRFLVCRRKKLFFFCFKFQVSRDVPSDQWILATLTWSAENGLFLYINGAEGVSTTVTTSVNNHDRSNRIVIGRSNAQDPANSFAEISTSIFVLFDMFVTKSEATDIYVYFWGHGKKGVLKNVFASGRFSFFFFLFFIKLVSIL